MGVTGALKSRAASAIGGAKGEKTFIECVPKHTQSLLKRWCVRWTHDLDGAVVSAQRWRSSLSDGARAKGLLDDGFEITFTVANKWPVPVGDLGRGWAWAAFAAGRGRLCGRA